MKSRAVNLQSLLLKTRWSNFFLTVQVSSFTMSISFSFLLVDGANFRWRSDGVQMAFRWRSDDIQMAFRWRLFQRIRTDVAPPRPIVRGFPASTVVTVVVVVMVVVVVVDVVRVVVVMVVVVGLCVILVVSFKVMRLMLVVLVVMLVFSAREGEGAERE